MQLHFSCDSLLESCKLLKKKVILLKDVVSSSNNFWKIWEDWRCFWWLNRSTSVCDMALMWFPSCQLLSISPTTGIQSLWHLWKVGKLHAHLGNELAHMQRQSCVFPPRVLTFCHTDQALSTLVTQALWSYLPKVSEHGTEFLNMTQSSRPHCCGMWFVLKWKTGFLRIQMLGPRG